MNTFYIMLIIVMMVLITSWLFLSVFILFNVPTLSQFEIILGAASSIFLVLTLTVLTAMFFINKFK